MDKKLVLSKVHHTLLNTTAKRGDVKKICDEAIEARTASVCISPCYVKQAAEYVQGKIPICTVIGFPDGTQTTEVKCFEAQNAIDNGAKEIDMVINVGWLKDGRYDDVALEIKKLHSLCHLLRPDGKEIILKVIIETCKLTDEEIILMTKMCMDCSADFIKTSTGKAEDGANEHVLQLMADTIKDSGSYLQIKAAGGIKDIATAERFIEIGAARLGTSKLIALYK